MDERAASREVTDTTYDVVIVGAGLGGLTTGALLSRSGKKVLVVEEQERPGGHAHASRLDGYTWDSAVHLVTRCSRTDRLGVGIVDGLLRHLGVRDRCEFIPVGHPFYTAYFPELTVSVPCGRDAYVSAHARYFPREESALRRLIDLKVRIARELLDYPEEPGIIDSLRARWQFPELFRYRNATLKQVVDHELHDPRLKSVYTALSSWVGSPPSRASFLGWAGMMGNYVEDGAYYCRGGYQVLADAVAAALTRAGGRLVLGNRVTRILTAGARVQGVLSSTGQRIAAPVVVSNLEPRVTFEELVGASHLPGRLLRKLRRLELSVSALAGYVATDLDVRSYGLGHENLYFASWDAEQGYRDALAGGLPGFSLHVPTLADPSLAPAGQHIVILSALAPADASADAGFAERLLSAAERLLPGLRGHLTAVLPMGAAAEGQFALNRIDRIYGAAMTPAQVGPKRSPHETPIHGLYLVGQGTQPGHGIPWVMESGVQVARHVLGLSSVEDVVPFRLTPAFAR